MNRITLTFLLGLSSIFGSANAAFAGNQLQANWAMPPGSRLDANNGCFSFVQQNDGNAVLYHNQLRQPLWSTGTYNRPVKHTKMQADGNLVTYDNADRAIWHTGTYGRGGTSLVMQDDGNLVMYAPGGRAVWASNTVRSCNASTTVPSQPAPAPQPPTVSTPRSVADANRYFKLQINDGQWNPQGPSSSNNCGPASVAALIKLFGKEANGIGVQQSINNARYYMGVSQNANVLTNNLEIERGLKAVGLRTGSHMDDGSWEILDKDLNNGMAVIAWGWWSSQWRSQFPNYNYSGATDHFISIVGKTPNGNYLVLDPMYRGGAVEMSRARLAVFFSYGGGGHNGTPYFITVAR
jgi:Peptidase_C39 like family